MDSTLYLIYFVVTLMTTSYVADTQLAADAREKVLDAFQQASATFIEAVAWLSLSLQYVSVPQLSPMLAALAYLAQPRRKGRRLCALRG